MRIDSLHPWTLDPAQAIALQQELRNKVVIGWEDHSINTVAGIDVRDAGEVLYAAVVVLELPGLSLIECAEAQAEAIFPYVPGLLAFRSGPVILAAWQKLGATPHLVMIHGHGIAHPRGLGLASHMGLWLGIPTIGVAKSRLHGSCPEVETIVGAWSEVRDEDDPKQVIGAAVRTKTGAKPVWVSPGHLIDLEHSIEYVLACCREFRMPEPIRLAYVNTVY